MQSYLYMGRECNNTAKIREGKRLATLTFVLNIRFVPTQKISAEPMKDK